MENDGGRVVRGRRWRVVLGGGRWEEDEERREGDRRSEMKKMGNGYRYHSFSN
jgi:hypothetical protein